ncbi:MAG TPA: family 1 glycosylhydrolase [Tepidisphaeraceae bacterium]|jgi:beta-glucosidase/6-phospho-beta-glucosidase/beta-galactosidase/glycosyltransferase involved in cell wall biosynthesis|nr:family 1 glycosylhydrolase [Tepidisphaeraceae bacterium]
MTSKAADHNGTITATQAPSLITADKLPFKQFVWGAGIECSFLPHLNVDQFDWTQHNRFWRDDFKRAKEELGITHLRYALPWHKLETSPGKFDWAMADERIEALDKLGINLMLDVMHFGTPLWLKQAVGDPEFPEALERFTTAIVGRYSSTVKTWCPFNEPLVSALFSGDFGFWPPHQRKWRGYMPVLSRIVQGVARGIRAIRNTAPESIVLLCDAVETYKTRVKSLETEVARRNMRRFLVMDLLTGRVDKHHPMFSWLNSYGMNELDLEWFRSNPQQPDVFGLDYYPHSDWQLDHGPLGKVRQRRADNPTGLYKVANAYWQRYGIPLMLTETSIEGQPINREIWLETNIDHIRRLREDGVPMLGLVWWPMIDQVDWDGALTHRVGKIHEVGLFNIKKTADGTMNRVASPLVAMFKEFATSGDEKIAKLGEINYPSPEADDEQLPPIGEWIQPTMAVTAEAPTTPAKSGGSAIADPVPGAAAEPAAAKAAVMSQTSGLEIPEVDAGKQTDRYGIVVFCHLRWGFVWQRPQQFLSRFAKKHPILFIEEPFFDRPEGAEPDLQFHRVMPNVTVFCPHVSPSLAKNPKLPAMLREWAKEAIEVMNENGDFERPVLWYYSPMDSAWSLGHFENRGVVYDCMDELSQFSGAPKQLVNNEARLIEHADVVFTGGYEMGANKKRLHDNVHIFGCGVEFSHFNKAQDPETVIPADIDFMNRPILGWFGVVDERVDYAMVGEMARMRPDWSFAMVGPVVKVDPNLLPHFPNLFWLGGRDYQQLPNYCAAFDVNMMCFANNAATQYINPTKGLEYMATGKPIISTPVKDVVRQWSDTVYIAKTAEEFVAAATKAMEQPDRERLDRGLALAKQSSWEVTVAEMQRLIKEAITKKERRSNRNIQPLTEMELEYQYQHTQGS